MRVPAAKRSALLSLMFLTVYGVCNWISAHRADVGVWYFAWERRIPFVPLMIVLYFSIDAFFVAAPFLCRDRAQLDLFARRVTVPSIDPSICFPLRTLRSPPFWSTSTGDTPRARCARHWRCGSC